MQTLDSLALFVAIADKGGFTAAANELGIPKSSVSRRISQYEEYLGLTLFRRSTRSISLTSDGLQLYKTAKPAIEAGLAAEKSLSKAHSEPVGNVVIACSASAGQKLLTPNVPSLVEKLPKIRLEIRIIDRKIDLAGEGIDIAIQTGNLQDSGLVARRLASTACHLVASPAYLNRAGRPKTPQDIPNHRCIVAAPSRSMWSFTNHQEIPVRWNIAAGNMLTCRELCMAGLGLCLVPEQVAKNDIAEGRLEIVLPDYPLPEASAWIVSTKQKHRSQAVQSVINHLLACAQSKLNAN